MIQPTTTPASPLAAQSPLVCRLRHRQVRRGYSGTAGELELENISGTVLDIVVRTSPLQYLDLVVTDTSGKVVSESYYGDLFSPLEEPYTLRLAPGQKYTGPVGFLGNVPPQRHLPGQYTAQAVYQYQGIRAVSEPLPFVVPEVSSAN
jgi:hypothetical protein